MDPWASVDGCRKSRATGIRSLDCPAHSESLYNAILAHRKQPLFYLNSCFVTVHLKILSLSLSSVMAVLQVLVIFYIYSDHMPWYSRNTNFKLLRQPNCNYVKARNETSDRRSQQKAYLTITNFLSDGESESGFGISGVGSQCLMSHNVWVYILKQLFVCWLCKWSVLSFVTSAYLGKGR